MKQILLIIALLLPVCAFSQFSETFDGPQLNAAWMGDRDLFTINSNGQLQFDASGRTIDTCSLYAPIVYSPDMEWNLDVSLTFNPSNSNHARIYVYATEKPYDVTYYIQVGHNDDNVSLYRKKGRIAKQVIIGKKGLLNSESSSIRVRLSMEKNRTWKLYTSRGNNVYTMEGVPFEEKDMQNIRSSGFLNITCKYSASSKENMFYYFDKIRVSSAISPVEIAPEEPEPPVIDPSDPSAIPPSLQDITQENASELLLSFDKPVDVSTAFFSLSEVGEADEVYISEDDLWVKLVWLTERLKDKRYELTYFGVVDKEGKECKGTKSIVSQYGAGPEEPDAPSAAGSVWINEVMAQPGDAAEMVEYIELYNTTKEPISLNQWIYKNVTGKREKILPDVTLLANSYAVLHDNRDTIPIDPSALLVPLEKFPSLNDKGASLQLLDATGKLIDEITYSKAKPGISWERSVEGWYLSTDSRGGTPGSENSSSEAEPEEPDTPEEPDEPEKPEEPETPDEPDEPDEPSIPEEPTFPDIMPQDIVFNELLPEPFIEGSEYIELYNRSGKAVSLKGLSVATRKTDGSLNTHYPLSSISATLPQDGYALLTKAKEGVSSLYLTSAPEAIHELKLPVLANTSSTLVLFRSKDEVVIDEVSYSSRWHASSVKEKKGVALERIDPEARTQDSGNWTSASETAGYGTPGYRNSQMKKPEEGGITGIEPPLFIDATGFYSIVYHLDAPGYNCRAYIFDLSGRRVAEITNHQLLGVEGELTWDGLASDGRRLGTGMYILCIELYHVGGQTRMYKKVFPVR